MLKIFSVLDKKGFSYWKDNIHNYKSFLTKNQINEKIKFIMSESNNNRELGFYRFVLNDTSTNELLNAIKNYTFYLYKSKQISIFFVIDESDNKIDQLKLKSLCRDIDNLKRSYNEIFDKFNELLNHDIIPEINEKIGEIKEIMLNNIDNIIQRGESLESLEKKSDELVSSAIRMKKKAKKLNSCCRF